MQQSFLISKRSAGVSPPLVTLACEHCSITAMTAINPAKFWKLSEFIGRHYPNLVFSFK
jgi:hypothetical protein